MHSSYLVSWSSISKQHILGCYATFSVFHKALSLLGYPERSGAVDELPVEDDALCLAWFFKRLKANA